MYVPKVYRGSFLKAGVLQIVGFSRMLLDMLCSHLHLRSCCTRAFLRGLINIDTYIHRIC